jgi:hypothetical protein
MGVQSRWQLVSMELHGGSFATPPAVCRFFGRLRLFARGTDNTLWHRSQTAPSNGWGPWESHGGDLGGEPVVAFNADALCQIFSRGANRELLTCVQSGPDGLGEWKSLGGLMRGTPAVGQNGDGRLEVFATGLDWKLWHTWQLAPNTGAEGWSGWHPFTGIEHRNPPAAPILNSDARLDVIFVGPNDVPHTMWQTAPANGWAGPLSLGGTSRSPMVASRNADGRLEIFMVGTDRQCYSKWQAAPSNGWVNGWGKLPLNHLVGPICVTRGTLGRLEVFGINDVGDLVHAWEKEPSSAPWLWKTRGGQTLGGLGIRLVRLGTREAWHFRE